MLRFRSLTAKFILIGLVIIAILAVYFHADFRFTRRMQGEAARINMAGRQRFLAMKMMYSANAMLDSQEKMSAKQVMDEMHRLHLCLVWKKGERNPERIIEEPTEKQAAILKAFGYKTDNGVLQKQRS